jgi:signal transduction histidine kinase
MSNHSTMRHIVRGSPLRFSFFPGRHYAWRIAVIYAVTAILWIVLTDALVAALASSIADAAFYSIAKGIAFVLVSATLIFYLTQRAGRRISEREQHAAADAYATQELVRRLPIFTWTVTPDGIVDVLRGQTEDGPLDGATVVGHRLEELLSDDYETSEEVADVLAAHRRVAAGDTEVAELQQRWRGHDLQVWLFPREGGGVVGAAFDITQRISLEGQLRRAQALEIVGRLSSGLAHDGNNLLHVIGANGALLGERLPAGSEERQMADLIVETARRGSSITHQLLALGRAGPTAAGVVDLADVVTGTEPLLRSAAGRSTIVIEHQAADEVLLDADASQLQQVLLNLVVNAVDALPERDGRIGVVTRRATAPRPGTPPELAPGKYGVLEVSDNGSGMDEPTLRRAFDPFFTTKAQDKGTGLGLPNVMALATLLGGTVTVASTPGEGSCFSVWMRETEHREPLPGDTPPTLDGHVLLLEDDESVRSIIRLVLETAGATVTEARPGDLQQLDIPAPDLVVAELNGQSASDRLRELKAAYPATALLGMSAVTTGSLDGVPVLSKPFDQAELIQVAGTLLAARIEGAPIHR